ncbi:MAG: adenine-specific methyltransferase EcoRI family protein [Bacteroidales bacterium]|nr:adenine-specific methyltransferase EcoRI family protein [Bacteroidales bacterium]
MQRELNNYVPHFKDKLVLCNCNASYFVY